MFSWCLALLGAIMMYVVPEENLVQLWTCGDVNSVFTPLCLTAFCYWFPNLSSNQKYFSRAREHNRSSTNGGKQATEENSEHIWNYNWTVYSSLHAVYYFELYVYILDQPDTNVMKCSSFRRTIWISIAVISYFSAVCDPWVYAIRMHDFRMALKELFQSMCRSLHLS